VFDVENGNHLGNVGRFRPVFAIVPHRHTWIIQHAGAIRRQCLFVVSMISGRTVASSAIPFTDFSEHQI
jgi:hypothetical protein